MKEAFPSRRSHTATGGRALRASNPCVYVFCLGSVERKDNKQVVIPRQRQKKRESTGENRHKRRKFVVR